MLPEFRQVFASPPIFESIETVVAATSLYNPPTLVVHYLGNIITQFLCVAGVNMLASCTTALSVTIILNLRKFTSIVFSFWYFRHPATLSFVIGVLFVFAGGKFPGPRFKSLHSRLINYH